MVGRMRRRYLYQQLEQPSLFVKSMCEQICRQFLADRHPIFYSLLYLQLITHKKMQNSSQDEHEELGNNPAHLPQSISGDSGELALKKLILQRKVWPHPFTTTPEFEKNCAKLHRLTDTYTKKLSCFTPPCLPFPPAPASPCPVDDISLTLDALQTQYCSLVKQTMPAIQNIQLKIEDQHRLGRDLYFGGGRVHVEEERLVQQWHREEVVAWCRKVVHRLLKEQWMESIQGVNWLDQDKAIVQVQIDHAIRGRKVSMQVTELLNWKGEISLVAKNFLKQIEQPKHCEIEQPNQTVSGYSQVAVENNTIFGFCHYCTGRFPSHMLTGCSFLSKSPLPSAIKRGDRILAEQLCQNSLQPQPIPRCVSKFLNSNPYRLHAKLSNKTNCSRKFCPTCLQLVSSSPLFLLDGQCAYCQGMCDCRRCLRNDNVIRYVAMVGVNGGGVVGGGVFEEGVEVVGGAAGGVKVEAQEVHGGLQHQGLGFEVAQEYSTSYQDYLIKQKTLESKPEPEDFFTEQNSFKRNRSFEQRQIQQELQEGLNLKIPRLS